MLDDIRMVALELSDAAAAERLLRAASPPRWTPMLVEQLSGAVRMPSEEARAFALHSPRRELLAVAVCGIFAGTRGAGRLHALTVQEGARGCGIGTMLLERVLADLRHRRARFILAEVPDDPPGLGDYWAFLARMGFREEGRVPDLFDGGVALAFLRRELTR